MQYKVVIKEVHTGYVFVDANNENEARDLADTEMKENGLFNTIDYEFEIEEVKKV